MRRKGPWALDPLHRSTASLPYSIEYHHVSNHSQAGSFNQHSKFNSNSIGSANSSQRRRRRSVRSNRSSQRASYQNPVTRLIDRYVDTSSQDSYNHLAEYLKTSTNNNLHTLGNGNTLGQGGQLNQAYGSNLGPGGQINQAYENRFVSHSIANMYRSQMRITRKANSERETRATSSRQLPHLQLTFRYSIASSGTYGVVDNVPSPPYTPYTSQPHPQPPPRNVETNM